jgi:hypothetical protein
MEYNRGIPIRTIDPNNPLGPKIDVFLPQDIVLRAFKYDSVKYENLRAAKEVLDNPKRIFWGIRANSEGGWCYVGKPTELYIKENETIAFPDGMVFAVYTTDRFEIFDWIPEYIDEEDHLSPKNFKERYGSLKWASTS